MKNKNPKNFHEKFNRTLEILVVIVLSVLVLDVLWQVFSRYVLSSPSSFTDELAGYLLIWVSLLGAAYVAGRKEHLAIDILLRKAPPERQKRLMILIEIIILLFAFTVMIVGGAWLMYTRFVLEVKSAALQLPLGYVYVVIPISGLIIAYYSVYHIMELVNKEI
jgi:TRAP-type C4-dicarboxylate transport system permease small subunit